MKNKTGVAIKIGLPLLVLIVLIIVRILTLKSDTSKDGFSPIKYVSVTFEGFDSVATASASVDREGLKKELIDDDMSQTEIELRQDFIESVVCTLDKNSKLSTGDKVKATVSYNENLAKKLGLDVGSVSQMFTVSNLEEGVKIDAFKDVQIITSGTSPHMYVTYSNQSEDDYIKSLTYSIDKKSNLAIGDTITITCEADENNARSRGYYFDTLTMTYTIEKADRYVTSLEEVPSDVVEQIKREAVEVIKQLVADTKSHTSYMITGDALYLYRDSNEIIENLKVAKTVFAYDNSDTFAKNENHIIIYLSGNIGLPNYREDDPYEYIEGWFAFVYSDAIIKMDGDFSMATNNPEKRYVCGTSYEDVLVAVEEEIGHSFDYTEY